MTVASRAVTMAVMTEARMTCSCIAILAVVGEAFSGEQLEVVLVSV